MRENVLVTPAGSLTLEAGERGLRRVRFGEVDIPFGGSAKLLARAIREFEEYFAGTRRAFDLPLDIRGTAFQLSVWRALREIPYGATASYGEIAARIGRPGAARAVGMANHLNLLPVIIPCHRVLGARGELTGYAGGIGFKRYLLELESRYGGI